MNKKILLFDVDGTIAESGQKINPEIKEFLFNIQNNNCEIGIVGGGKYEKIKYQLDGLPVKHLFSESGCVYHLDDKEVYIKSLREHKLYPKINIIIKTALSYLSQVDYTITGNFIDLRNGIIYISLIGMCATQEERKYFMDLDKKYNYRENLINILKNKSIELNINNELDILEGGSVGIGIYPKEWDKTQVLDYLDKSCEIFYFGDKYTTAGNDYRLLNNDIVKGYPVDCPEDTLKILLNNFN